MFIIDVIPLRYLPRSMPQIYSYFSLNETIEGSLVAVSMGRQEVLGIVVSCCPATSKLALKKSDFKVKPLKKQLASWPVVSRQQLNLASWLADYYFLPLSGTLESLLPNEKILSKTSISPIAEINIKKERKSFYVLGDNFDWLIKKINETVKSNRQAFLLFPNQIKLDFYRQKWADLDILVWGENKSQKSQINNRAAINNGSAKVIFGLQSAIGAPFQNLGLVAVIGEENYYFESWGKKISFNSKTAAIYLAEIFQADLVLSGHLPSVESWQWAREKIFQPVSNQKELLSFTNKEVSFVFPDFSKEEKKIFFPKSVIAIEEALNKKEKIFVFANRLGLSPALSCQECGYTVECPSCEAAMMYSQSPAGFQVRCRHCGLKDSPPNTCPKCQSHLMLSRGIGTQKALAELNNILPKAKIKIFDSDHIKSSKEEERVLTAFKSGELDIIVGTELFLKHIRNFVSKGKLVDLSLIISFGQLINFPDFRGRERTRNLLASLAANSKELIIQNFRWEEIDLDDWLISEKFYPKELVNRQKLLYPPFSEFIKISFEGRDKQKISKLSAIYYRKLKKAITESFPIDDFRLTPPLPAIISKTSKRYGADIFLRIKKSTDAILPSVGYIEKRNNILDILPIEASIRIEPINPLK